MLGFQFVAVILGNNDLPFYVRNPYPKDFVLFVLIYAHKANALNGGVILVGGFLQYAFVKRQPAQFFGIIKISRFHNYINYSAIKTR